MGRARTGTNARSSRSRARAAWKKIRTIKGRFFVLALIPIAAWIALRFVYPRTHSAGGTSDFLFVPIPGEDPSAIATRLADGGAIDHPFLFSLYLRVMDAPARLRNRPVLLISGMTPRAVLERIAVGYGPGRVQITIPEGFTRFDIAKRLDRWDVCGERAFVDATMEPRLLRDLGLRGPTAEGYLFPDTYGFDTESDPAEVVSTLVGTFRRRVMPLIEDNPAGLAALHREFGWGIAEVMTLASIVEKEARMRDEQAVIAGVYLNRLRDASFVPRKRLQADPTVAYGCLADPNISDACAHFDGRRVTRAMTQDGDNRYNTYRHEGLPPGPVANPGRSAIAAVLAPARHRYLFFVAKGGGRHTFSETLSQHNDAVETWRAIQTQMQTQMRTQRDLP